VFKFWEKGAYLHERIPDTEVCKRYFHGYYYARCRNEICPLKKQNEKCVSEKVVCEPPLFRENNIVL
jgi:hypothetical protein